MKYNDNGEYKDIYIKTFDTLPVGAEVDYDGNSVPDGWTQINEKGRKFFNSYNGSQQTISGSTYTAIDMMTLKFTTTGNDILVSYGLYANMSASGTGTIKVYVDGVEYGTNFRAGLITNTTPLVYNAQFILTNIPAGEHTIKLYAKPDASYNIVFPSPYQRYMCAIEL